jgi:DTW domain-containing protein YfiP
MSRDYCYTCMRSICLCSELNPIDNQTHVLILQDRLERKNTKNTAKIFHLSLKNSKIIVGSNFHNDLKNIKNLKNYLLVFPSHLSENKSINLSELKDKSKFEGIILIDGTWKKAKKIYYTHPELHELMHLNIDDKSNEYIIRKSPNEKSLSTFEAGYFALKSLNNIEIEKIYSIFRKLNEITINQKK